MIILPLAEADLVNARDWYDWRRDGLGSAFLLSIEEAFERINRAPETYPFVHRDLRRALIQRFPYAVYYRIESDEVAELGIFHAARAPGEWESRE